MNDTDPRIRDLLLAAVKTGASDLHIVAGDPPTCRQHGRLKPIAEQALDGETIAGMLDPICTRFHCRNGPPNNWDTQRARLRIDYILRR